MWASNLLSSLDICHSCSSRIWLQCFFAKDPWLQQRHSSSSKLIMLAIAASNHLAPTSTSIDVGATLFFPFNFGAVTGWKLIGGGTPKMTIEKGVPPTEVGLIFKILLRPSCVLKHPNSLSLIVTTVATNLKDYPKWNSDWVSPRININKNTLNPKSCTDVHGRCVLVALHPRQRAYTQY